MAVDRVKVLVSSCLLGEKVRYHGGDAALDHPVLERWRREGRIVPVCPEVGGGLPTPRPPAEIQGGGGADVLSQAAFVRRRDGVDVTDQFRRGAEAAVALAREHGISVAVLKDLSPSCGTTTLYDGSFSGGHVAGQGVTAAALQQAGVRVFSERELDKADEALSEGPQPRPHRT
ncbi:MAG TPA: DUF523 domain-containing protein [Vicinamibacterales bacterium]|nr:DUF523 domain-containing protein [Vicinamibacterales bacterium]